MGFFAEFSAWLETILATYVAGTTATLATALEPLAVTLGTLYLMIWGYLCLSGQVQEPLLASIKRFIALGVVLGLSLKLWLFNEVIVGTAFRAPANLAAVLVGAFDSTAIVDQILLDGADAAAQLMARGTLLNGISFDIAGLLVYVTVGVTATYAMFLLSLSKVALSVLLAVGPLFLLMALFATTRRFVESWAAQLINYALVTIMTTLVAALMLHVLASAAASALAAGGEIQIAHGMRVCVAALLTLLVMRQVLPMCAGLASGLGLVTQNAVSTAMWWALGTGRRTAGEFLRGTLDREPSRWDSASRRAGYHMGQGVRGVGQLLSTQRRYNVISRS